MTTRHGDESGSTLVIACGGGVGENMLQKLFFDSCGGQGYGGSEGRNAGPDQGSPFPSLSSSLPTIHKAL
jgi:hypothetical protein